MEASLDRTSRRYKIAGISGPTDNQKQDMISKPKTHEELISVLKKQIGVVQGSEGPYTPIELERYINRAFKIYDTIYGDQKPNPKNLENGFVRSAVDKLPRALKLRSKVKELIISEHWQKYESNKKN